MKGKEKVSASSSAVNGQRKQGDRTGERVTMKSYAIIVQEVSLLG